MKKLYEVEEVRFNDDGTIAEGGLWNTWECMTQDFAVFLANESYKQMCTNDKKSHGFLVNEYEDDEYIGCVFEASRFTETEG